MKNFLTVLTVGLVLITTSMDADAARRFGGGKSFGRPAPTLMQKAPQPAANPQKGQQQQAQRPAAAANPAAAAAAKPSPWKGMLMGAAAALGITALLSALGLGEGFAQVIMMVLLAAALFFAVRFVMGMMMGSRARTASASGMPHREPLQPQRETAAHFESVQQPQSAARPTPASAMSGSATPGSVFDVFQKAGAAGVPELKIPEGFDAAGFEAVAKDNFVKLQKAWDTGDVNEISDFTTDDFFIEVTHKLRERDTKVQESEVINLSAKLLGFVEGDAENVGVVAFEGAMKIAGEFEQVNEHWVLVQKADGSTGWLLAGISQVEETVN